MWALLYTKAAKYVAAVVAFFAMVAAIYFKGRGAGKEVEKQKQELKDKKATEETLKKLENKANVQNEVSKLPDGAAADKLRNDWTRD